MHSAIRNACLDQLLQPMSPFPSFMNWEGCHGLEQLIETGIAYGAVHKVNPEVMMGMTNVEGKGTTAVMKNQWSAVAPPAPTGNMTADNAYFMYNSIVGYSSTPQTGLVYKHFVK